jgi:hypothetical protein
VRPNAKITANVQPALTSLDPLHNDDVELRGISPSDAVFPSQGTSRATVLVAPLALRINDLMRSHGPRCFSVIQVVSETS